MNKTIIATAVAVLAAPVMLCGLVVVAATGAISSSAVTAAAAACSYANPDADRVEAAMLALTPRPVNETRWNRYRTLAGLDDTDTDTFEQSTPTDREAVFHAAIANILAIVSPHAVTTPPLIWWNGTMPTDDNDTSWQTTPVDGFDGTLNDYLAAFTNSYIDTDIDTDPTCVPPYTSVCPQPINIDAIAATIRTLESGNNYTEASRAYTTNPDTTGTGWPSGAYQYLRATWNGYAGYDEAHLAPAATQDQRAIADITRILTDYNDPSWVPVVWYVGPAAAARIANGDTSADYIPNPDHNTISVADYRDRWMHTYTTTSLPDQHIAPVNCPQGATAVIAWAETQIGAPYAAIDPYRFGTPRWPGGTLTGFRGDHYTFPAGTTVYDCSGFVIAAWRTAGIDFAGQYGIYGSQAFITTRLLDVPRAAVLPGDIAVYSPVNGVGHVVLIHHTDTTSGTVYTIEASPSRGVTIRPINWTRVTAIKRPTVPG